MMISDPVSIGKIFIGNVNPDQVVDSFSGSMYIYIGAGYIPTLYTCSGGKNWKSVISNSLIVENRITDPVSPVTGQIWLRTDL